MAIIEEEAHEFRTGKFGAFGGETAAAMRWANSAAQSYSQTGELPSLPMKPKNSPGFPR